MLEAIDAKQSELALELLDRGADCVRRTVRRERLILCCFAFIAFSKRNPHIGFIQQLVSKPVTRDELLRHAYTLSYSTAG